MRWTVKLAAHALRELEGGAMQNKGVPLGYGRGKTFMRVWEAAEILDVSAGTIEAMCRDGQIRAIKVRTQWRIYRDRFMSDMGLEGEGTER